ncbi:MAG: lysophospholipid acyltransferase family protein [bacterium]|nr:lysophospholipid acyltransferase family protein [bacterium]MCP5071597.1 lysophospholipid acyltransferase family protein [bacterium]
MGRSRDTWQYRIQVRLLAWLAAGFLRLLGATWRVRTTGDSPFVDPPFVAAIWHRGLLAAAILWKGRGIAVPVSRSRDGDQIDAVMQRLGFAASPRGSTSRGATSLLREMIRRVRSGQIVAMLPDGPRGPAGQAKPGVVALARAGGVRLVPVGLAAGPAIRFGSWDSALLPLPFARVHCHYGEPLIVPKGAKGEELERFRLTLERELDRLNRELEAGL